MNDVLNPESCSRRILLAVTGLSPQVVTETLYALAVKNKENWTPTEVHLITTKEGAERVRHALLHPQQGHFHRFCQDYDISGIDFTMKNVHKFQDATGDFLDDIRQEADNRSCADMTTELVRELTSDDKAALHVSIAGGRKTMGFYLGYALSLYGRPWDRLSHVLVSTPYESHKDFYYPPPESRLIYSQGGNPRAYDSSEAEVTLANIPFVRLREGLPASLQRGEASFSQTVAAAQRALEAPQLVIDLKNRRLRASGEIIEDIPPADLAFYSWMARRCLAGCNPVRHEDDNVARDYLREYQQLVNEYSADYERVERALKQGMDQEYFDQRKSRSNKMLKNALPPQLYSHYAIGAFGHRPRTRYGLRMAADVIRYGELPAVQDIDASDGRTE